MTLRLFCRRYKSKEAAIACLNYGFTTMKDNSIIAITQEANHRSCRLLKAIGMKNIKTFRRYNASQRLYEVTRHEQLRLKQLRCAWP